MRDHGTRTKYVHDGCRCLPCRVAATNYETARQAARRKPWRVRHVLGPGPYYGGNEYVWMVVRHDGTGSGHVVHSREEAYRLRNRLNRAEQRPDPIWASGTTDRQVREHLAYLAREGVGLHQVAHVTRVSRSRLVEIARGRAKRKGRPEVRRLRHATAERILGVGLSDAAPRARVDAAETWRLIEVLLRAGYTKGRLALMLGASRPALQLRADRVTARNARKVRALYEALWNTDPRVRQAADDAPNDAAAAERKRFRKLAQARSVVEA